MARLFSIRMLVCMISLILILSVVVFFSPLLLPSGNDGSSVHSAYRVSELMHNADPLTQRTALLKR